MSILGITLEVLKIKRVIIQVVHLYILHFIQFLVSLIKKKVELFS